MIGSPFCPKGDKTPSMELHKSLRDVYRIDWRIRSPGLPGIIGFLREDEAPLVVVRDSDPPSCAPPGLSPS